jgi:thymidine kinase
MNGASPKQRGGALIAVVGPMGAGKTDYALRRLTKAALVNQGVWIANPIDTRSKRLPTGYSVFTHAGATTIPAELVVEAQKVDDAPSLATVKLPFGVTTVFIDEVQFYPPAEIQAVVIDQWVLQWRLKVYCIGLVTNAVLQMWPAVQLVLERATAIKQKRAHCAWCGAPAGHTVAQFDYAASGGAVCVGTLEQYKACCLPCHQLEEKKKAEAKQQ